MLPLVIFDCPSIPFNQSQPEMPGNKNAKNKCQKQKCYVGTKKPPTIPAAKKKQKTNIQYNYPARYVDYQHSVAQNQNICCFTLTGTRAEQRHASGSNCTAKGRQYCRTCRCQRTHSSVVGERATYTSHSVCIGCRCVQRAISEFETPF